ncbi:MAG: hypothetical protein GEU28_13190 [Dehalococcoidia bacterium]|nr:hypothetical protein [Dehalococcoidia bacterium]
MSHQYLCENCGQPYAKCGRQVVAYDEQTGQLLGTGQRVTLAETVAKAGVLDAMINDATAPDTVVFVLALCKADQPHEWGHCDGCDQ